MRVHTVEAPAGLVVVLREFKVEDEDLLADPALQRKGVATTELLRAVTVSLEDPGPYDFADDVDWSKVLQGERHHCLKENRIFTWDEEYWFEESCPKCRAPGEHPIDLSEAETKKLPDSSLDHVSRGTPLTCVLPGCGKRVAYRLLRGKDERALQKIKKENKRTRSSSYLRLRIEEVEGVEHKDLKRWIRDLGGKDSSFLRAEFEEADCGIDMEVLLDCDRCDHAWRQDLRFDAEFLFPKYRKRSATR